MRLHDEQYAELIDRVVDEGEPELIIGPLAKPPSELPAHWIEALKAHDPYAAIAQLWKPMEMRLPRVCQALRDRLQGIGLLRTEEREQSLLYFFADEESVFAFRGYPALSTELLDSSQLPQEFLDFYQIHNGWVNYDSEDGGPLPIEQWLPIPEVWPDVTFTGPPGDSSPDAWIRVFHDDPELALVFDTSTSPVLPLRCRNDGTIDVLLDIWISIDREIGEFLEQMRVKSGRDLRSIASSVESRNAIARRRQELLIRLAARRNLAAHLGAGGAYEQLCDLSLWSAMVEKLAGGKRETVVEHYRESLQYWCASVDSGGDVSPEELLYWFGIAHALGDTASAHFVAMLPPSLWADETLQTLQARTLFCLYLGDAPHANEFLDEILGRTFDEEEAPDVEDEIVAQLLEALTRKDRAAFTKARRRAAEELANGRIQQQAVLPWNLRLPGFDAVARMLGM
jgi:hypothetical protein